MYENEKPDFLNNEVNQVDSDNLSQFRRWFSAAVEHSNKWRTAAKEDYDFVAGKQWTEDEWKTFEEEARPALVINRIKPLLNVLSGYQRLNRYDVDFLARTSDDVELAQVRRGMTKYVFDRCDYDTVESQVFMDCAIGGVGWFNVKFKFDHELNDGEAVIERVDPFSIYIDPETHDLDFSDAKYIFRAKWCDKDDLKNIYTDKADAIENAFYLYDHIEDENRDEDNEIDPSWYNSELRKVRVVECWYKVKTRKTVFFTNDGQMLDQSQINDQMIQAGIITQSQEIPTAQVKCCVFFDRTLLEELDSPYQHGEFPYIPMIYHYYGVGDLPAGFVRDLKDPQREINKRRIQELHLLNNSANGGGFYQQGSMTPEQKEEFRQKGNIPGHYQEVVQLDLIRERQPQSPPTAIIQAEQQATNDLTSISGINEQLLGTDTQGSASGRAIELRQKQAITHLAVIFDALRRSKKKLVSLLWGRRGHAGIIPQYYTAEKSYRIEGENGQEWITVNQQIIQQDPIAGVIYKTLKDLSQGEFDIVIADTESSATQRQAQLWSLVDAVSKLQIPADMIFDTIIDLSDLPKKNDIKQRWQQRQQEQMQQQQQAAEAQIRLEEIKNRDFRQAITFKDAPLPIQLAMCAQAGYLDINIANQIMQAWLSQIIPQFTQPIMQQQQIQPPPQMTPQDITALAALQQQPQMQNQPATMTQAAAQSVMNGITPSM